MKINKLFFQILVLSAPFFLTISFGPISANTQLLQTEACEPPAYLQRSWTETDFSKCIIDLSEIISGGPGRDGIPPIDSPEFQSIKMTEAADNEPVISIQVAGVAKAYPLSILMWHEIVNDTIAGMPIAVTYCPLCNTSIVFDRRSDDLLLDFGTTGSLRFSDLLMYDRQTLSFWQQYSGEAIAGDKAGAQLEILPSRLESYALFKRRHPDGQIMAIPNNFQRRYGTNPYVGYDSSEFPFLFTGEVPEHIKPLERVVVFDEHAITLEYLKTKISITHQEYIVDWEAGQASALDSVYIAKGRDVGNVTVRQKHSDAAMIDVPYKVTFAFVWHAFNPDRPIIGQKTGQ